MDELRLLTKKERRQAYEQVFREAFPPAELKPLRSMEQQIAAGAYDFLGFFREGIPLGYACCWKDGRFILIDYLCVRAEERNGGAGGRILTALRARYPADTVFIGESEAPVGDPGRDALILRRLNFDRRSGAVFLDYDCALFGVHYKTMVWATGPVDQAEVQRHHDAIYRRSFPRWLYDKAVQLPLQPGEAIKPRQVWDERPERGEEEI